MVQKTGNKFYKMGENVFYPMYQMGKRYWEVGIIVKRIGRMIYLVKGPKMVHKRCLNQTKSRHTDEENNTQVDVEPIEVLFDIFDVPIPQKAPEAKIQKSQKKRRYTERIDINS